VTPLDFVILALAAWRLAYMLVNEDGPGAVFSRLRYRLGVRSVVTRGNDGQPEASKVGLKPWSELWLCVWCMSVWTATALVLLALLPWEPLEWLRLLLAVSAGAIVIHEAIERLRR
jgi:hypothetical protein